MMQHKLKTSKKKRKGKIELKGIEKLREVDFVQIALISCSPHLHMLPETLENFVDLGSDNLLPGEGSIKDLFLFRTTEEKLKKIKEKLNHNFMEKMEQE